MHILTLLLLPVLALAQDKAQITISQVQHSGNGCPQNTVSTSISPDKTVSNRPYNSPCQLDRHAHLHCPFIDEKPLTQSQTQVVTVGFDRFQTYIGPGTTIMDRSKNCQLHLTLKYPAGFSFAVIDSTYHGFAQLEEGVTGTFFSTYYFSSDAARTSTTQTSIQGGGVWADGQVYTKSDAVPGANVVRSPCGGSTAILNINNRLSLTSRDSSASGMLSNDDATASLTQQVHIDWYRC
jgi:hypothetical protein